jgi:PST family polysaccharide transporter
MYSLIATESIIQQAKRSVKWSVLIEVVSRTAQPVIFLVLARLLTPSDFGLSSAAAIVIGFSQMLWDAGLGKALVQTKEDVDSAANVVFWVNSALGAVIYVTLFAAAPWIAAFFDSVGFVPVLRVLGIRVIILSLCSVQQALLQRGMSFRQLFGVKLVTAVIPGLFSIPMALAGWGVWALVAGSLAGALVNLILLWRGSSWRPKINIQWSVARRLISFGLWVVGESLVGWFITSGDNLVVGHFLGVQALGIYTVAWNIGLIVFGLLISPLQPVLFSAFSRLQDDRIALIHAFDRANRIVGSISLPVGVGMLLVASSFVDIFLGPKWQGLGLVLGLIALMFGVAWLVGMNAEVYRSIGRPDINTKLLLGFLLLYVPAYLVAAQFNLEVFSYMRFAVALVTLPIHIFLAVHVLGLPPMYFWKEYRSIMLSVSSMAVCVIATQRLLVSVQIPPILKLGMDISIGGIFYILVLFLLDKEFVIQAFHLFRDSIALRSKTNV